MNLGEILTRLRGIPVFAPLTDEELETVLLQCQIGLYQAGRVVFHEGQHGDSLMVVLQGAVSLRCKSDEGVTVELATLREGAILGEMAVIDPGARAATAVALETSILLIMREETLENLIQAEHPAASQVLRAVLQSLAQRCRAMDDRIEQVFTSRLEGQAPPTPRSLWSILQGNRP